VADAVRAVAAERELPPARVALAWLFGRPGVTAPLIGATKPHHLDDALAAIDVRLTSEEVARLEASYLPRLATSYA
jgi:aryl-alcohol dehydrogenase-like predicted oxidoreductase